MYWKRTLGALCVITALCLALGGSPTAAQDGGPAVGIELVAEGLTHPVDLDEAPDDSGRLFITDQIGVIYVMTEGGTPQPFLDLRDRMVELDPGYDERGALGLAFHPDFANNGRFFVYYSAPLRAEAPPDWNHTSHLSEFTVAVDNPDAGDPASERIIMMVDQPQTNHNAGDITFGPDGFLYVPLGDGGGADDVGVGHTEGIGNGQDWTNLLGSILRIDVDGGDPYGIPEDNPFLGNDAVPPETWAYGFRNPWGLNFDTAEDGTTSQLFIADAGQNLYEEVSIVEAGGNYGWNIKEGTHCFDPNAPDVAPAECPTTGPNGDQLTDPVIEFGHDVGNTVVGGAVYRGQAVPELQGQYVFAVWSTSFDFPAGTLLVAMPSETEGELWSMQPLTMTNAPEPMFILSVEEDANNELYVLTTLDAGPAGSSGRVWRIVSSGGVGGPTATPGTQEPTVVATEEPGDGTVTPEPPVVATEEPGDGTATLEPTVAATEDPGDGVTTEEPGDVTETPAATIEPPLETVTPDPAGTQTGTPGDSADAPLVVSDQTISGDGTVLITRVFSEAAGWLVIHADDSGKPGVVIGYVAVPAGESANVAVPIEGSSVTGVLHAMLHVDAGTLGQYEFPGADVPATDAQGNMIVRSFNVTVTG